MARIGLASGRSSWLRHCEVTVADVPRSPISEPAKTSWFGMFVGDEIEENSDDFEYTVDYGERLPALAERFYGDPLAWWVLAKRNDIWLPDVQVYPGLVLIVPDPKYVKDRYLGSAQSIAQRG